ncbi:MAG: error-prone DNA polymerase [Gammaproteobacteria bacterium]|nr:error-prone DNA polymerase [Gammaproteobacteria bacterium]
MATLPERSRGMQFAELHCLSNYSFLRSASHPEELIKRAAKLGYEAIAITDECSFAGLVKAHMAAKEHGIKLIVGAEFLIDDTDGARLVLLAPTRCAYGQLAAFITKLRRRSPKGEYLAKLDDFRWAIDECLTLWVPGPGGIQSLVPEGERLKTLFPRLWIALELFRESTDLDKAANALTLATRLGLPIVASNDVHTHHPGRQPLQDVMTAIRLKTTVAELGTAAFGNAERSLRPIATLQTLYPPEMLSASIEIADQCHFCMDELRYEYPEELVPPHLTPHEYLRQLTLAGARERWPDGVPEETLETIDKELELVKALRYEYYFLTVQDIVQFARNQGILCQGRGSAANSAVCYCLHITEVDPSRMHLLFERFVSKERNEPPDIDVDFEHERREEVIQYIYKRYGRDRAALAATLITYRPKSAIRDVGKALGMDLDLIDLLAKSLAWWDKREALEERFRQAGLDPNSQLADQFLLLVNEILGFPRHLSQHVGGFVISKGPLAQLVPVENAAMADRTVIQWDKYDLEALGLLKIDVLGLGMLTAIRKTLAAINGYRGTNLSVDSIPPEDPDTYRMLQKGDSVGVFQVESRAQMAMLPRLKPQHFYDLVIEVAIVRPGPIQGDMVHPYLRRRQGLEPVTYSSDGVRRVLERTLGVPIFQEQVIELAMVAAGFSAGEADQLRRAMAAWKRHGGLEHFEQKLINGMLARGHGLEFAERVFKQIQGFGEYGFPESHAASFALIVYVSAWLKCHEPAAFYCGLLNSLPMGFYSPSQLIQDAKRHHIEVFDADVQCSHWDHQLQPPTGPDQPALRLGLRLVKGLQEEVGLRIAAAQPFNDMQDLWRRANIDRQSLQFLARAGALKQLSGHRYQAHWDVAAIDAPTPLEEVADAHPEYETSVSLPGPSAAENVLDDYRYLSLSLGPHPMRLLRGKLDRFRTAADLERFQQGQFVQVAGLVTGRQRPGTATGVLFVTLEDETGNINVIVWSSVLERFRAALLQGRLLKIKGVVERENEVIHVVAGQVLDASCLLADISHQQSPFKSRDFR